MKKLLLILTLLPLTTHSVGIREKVKIIAQVTAAGACIGAAIHAFVQFSGFNQLIRLDFGQNPVLHGMKWGGLFAGAIATAVVLTHVPDKQPEWAKVIRKIAKENKD